MRLLSPILPLVAALALVACDGGPTAVREVSTQSGSLNVQGTNRSYRFYVPEGESPAEGRAVVLVFHGATQGATGIELMSWMYPVADEHDLILAFPQSTGDYWNTPNSPLGYWDVPDVPFVDAVLSDLDSRFGVDDARIYAAGFSNGAIFAQVVGCTRSTRIAAIAVVGASVASQVAESCPFERPMPGMILFGDADPQFYWDAGFAGGSGMLGGRESAEWWASLNGCRPGETVSVLPDTEDDQTTVERWEYADCEEELAFYRIRGGGHTWPGSPLNLGPGFGRKTRDIDASRLMADFFMRQVLRPGSVR